MRPGALLHAIAAATFVAVVAVPTQALAGITAFWSAGAGCSGSGAASFVAGGAPVTFSLCATTTIEKFCGATVTLESAAGENDRFQVTNRTNLLFPDPTEPNPAFPVSIHNPASPVDFGGTINDFNSPLAGGANRLLVTLEITPLSNATNNNYVLHLNGASEIDYTNGSTCSPDSLAAQSIPAALTLNQQGAPALANFQGLWWASPAGSESGWGVNVTHQGDTLFATWFTYDLDGSGLWLVMSNGARVAANSYSGALYRTTGPSFSSTFDPSRVVVTQVGTATFTFTDANNGTFTATVNGVTMAKPITRQIFSSPVPVCAAGSSPSATNFQDLWWRSPAGSESGWGVNITHQGDILFATWFTYGSDGNGMWLVMSAGAKQADGSYQGTLYRTTGPAFNAVPWNPAGVGLTVVGSATFRFSNANSGTFTYTVNGVTQSKPITRQVYSSPITTCN